MSMLAFALFGLAPVGGLHLGTWAQYVGTPAALAGGGFVCLLVAAGVLVGRPELRRPIVGPARTVTTDGGQGRT